jgi:hypothetical protein
MKKNLLFILLPLFFLVACNSYSDHTEQFRILSESLTKSGGIIRDNNQLLYMTFEQKRLDPQTAGKVQIWYPKAMQLKKLAIAMTAYVDQLKTTLKDEAGLKKE